MSFPGWGGDAEQEDGDINDEDEHGDPDAKFFEFGVDGFVFVHRDAVRAGEGGLVEAAPAPGFTRQVEGTDEECRQDEAGDLERKWQTFIHGFRLSLGRVIDRSAG